MTNAHLKVLHFDLESSLKNTVKKIRNVSHNVLRRFNETLNVRNVFAVSAVLAWSFSQSVPISGFIPTVLV